MPQRLKVRRVWPAMKGCSSGRPMRFEWAPPRARVKPGKLALIAVALRHGIV